MHAPLRSRVLAALGGACGVQFELRHLATIPAPRGGGGSFDDRARGGSERAWRGVLRLCGAMSAASFLLAADAFREERGQRFKVRLDLTRGATGDEGRADCRRLVAAESDDDADSDSDGASGGRGGASTDSAPTNEARCGPTLNAALLEGMCGVDEQLGSLSQRVFAGVTRDRRFVLTADPLVAASPTIADNDAGADAAFMSEVKQANKRLKKLQKGFNENAG